MALSKYRIHSANLEDLRSELNAVLASIDQRIAAAEATNATVFPNAAQKTATGGFHVVNLAPATDQTGAVTLGQLFDAITNLKQYIDTKGATAVKYTKRKAQP